MLGGVVALLVANRMSRESREVGSLTWFLDGLKLDLEVAGAQRWSQPGSRRATARQQRSPPSDIAA